MKESKLFRTFVITFVVIGLGALSNVLAQTGSRLEITVSYADLNLENEEGMRVLYGRLQQASKEVCGATASEISGTIARLNVSQCYRETLAEAVGKIDNLDPTTFVVIGLGDRSVVLAGTLSPLGTTVSYADLNLENEEGIRVLYRRLQQASEQVCVTTGEGAIQLIHFDQCYRETLAEGVGKIDNENLTRMHAE